jgi:transcriptional regulator with XRE-family HTH domain
MSPEQCRAARAWLNWSQNELAAKAQVSNSTLRDFESGRRVPIANNLLAIRRALEDAGMQLLFSQEDEKPWGVAVRAEDGEREKLRNQNHRKRQPSSKSITRQRRKRSG